MNRAAYLHKCVMKLAKWSNKAEDAETASKATKALRKYAKWSNRLAEAQRESE